MHIFVCFAYGYGICGVCMCVCNVHIGDMYTCVVWCVGRHMSVLVLHVYICVYDIVCVGGR